MSDRPIGAALDVGPADSEWFADHGWWVSPPILSEEQLEELEYGIERYYARSLDWHLPAVPPGDSPPSAAPTKTRQNDYVSLQVAEIRSFVLGPLLGWLACTVGGHQGVRLFHDQLISKPPGTESVGWHSDRSYWLTCSCPDMLTIWVPLQDVGTYNGSLQVVDGSHLLELDHQALRGFHDPMRRSEAWDPRAVRTLELRRGQISLHHARTVHGSGSNLGDAQRVALAIHLQPIENHYVRPPVGAPALHFNDILCRRGNDGHPDYTDPHVCPQVWPPRGGG